MLRRTEGRVSIEVICGPHLRVEGIALDVSENELRLELERPLSKEMSVEIIFAEGALILFGELEYCQPAERGEEDLILLPGGGRADIARCNPSATTSETLCRIPGAAGPGATAAGPYRVKWDGVRERPRKRCGTAENRAGETET